MAERPLVLVLSNDDLLGELLSERFRQDHLDAETASTLAEATAHSEVRTPAAIVIDAIGDPSLATRLLDTDEDLFAGAEPPYVILAGSTTPPRVRDHGHVDRVITVPASSDAIVEATRYCLAGRARRGMNSGIRTRSAVVETFRTKTGSLRG